MEEKLEKKLKRKRLRKVIVIALLMAVAVAVVCGLSIEKPQQTEGGKGNATSSQNAGDEPYGTVTMSIDCSDLARNMDALEDKALEEYIPKDGVILPPTEYEFKEDESVYDCLESLCRSKEIHLESANSTTYGSRYIEGIGHLYEKDAGLKSGWTYEVDGEMPNYGCSEFKLEDGQKIEWKYVIDYTDTKTE